MTFGGLTPREKQAKADERRARRTANAAFNASVDAQLRPENTILAGEELTTILDILFSQWVRLRDIARYGRCRICETRPIEVCYHVIPRGANSIRWAEDNGWGACGECNTREQQNRESYKILHRQIMGDEAYEALAQRGREIADWSIEKMIELRGELLKKIETLK